MRRQANQIDGALEAIEQSILPSLSQLLDGLLDSAALARPGIDAEAYAAELRQTAHRLSGLTELVAAVAPLAQSAAAPHRISA